MRMNGKFVRLSMVAALVMILIATTMMPALAKTNDDQATAEGDKGEAVEYVQEIDPSNACASIGLTGDAFKIDGAPVNGIYRLKSLTSNTELNVTISYADGKFFSWDGSSAIGAVVVKAGTGANVFWYPKADKQGLHAPGFLKKDGSFVLRQISNVTFCEGEEQPEYPQ